MGGHRPLPPLLSRSTQPQGREEEKGLERGVNEACLKETSSASQGCGAWGGRQEDRRLDRSGGASGHSDEFPLSQVMSTGLPGRVSFGEMVRL